MLRKLTKLTDLSWLGRLKRLGRLRTLMHLTAAPHASARIFQLTHYIQLFAKTLVIKNATPILN